MRKSFAPPLLNARAQHSPVPRRRLCGNSLSMHPGPLALPRPVAARVPERRMRLSICTTMIFLVCRRRHAGAKPRHGLSGEQSTRLSIDGNRSCVAVTSASGCNVRHRTEQIHRACKNHLFAVPRGSQNAFMTNIISGNYQQRIETPQTCFDFPDARFQPDRPPHSKGTSIMGKYLVGWILGVPVFVLVIIYLIFN
jgi:hypothetical protein